MKACSMCAAARPLASVVDTATETADTTIETTAGVATEMVAETAVEKISEKTTERAAEKMIEKTAERTTKKAARSMMMLKIKSKLITLKTEMIDVDDIFDFENPSLRHVKLTL